MQTPYTGTMTTGFKADAEPARAHGITGRELEALCLAAEGLTSKEAGARMRISDKTVRVHLSTGARKLGARTTAAATALALSYGILVLESAPP